MCVKKKSNLLKKNFKIKCYNSIDIWYVLKKNRKIHVEQLLIYPLIKIMTN